MKIFFNYYRGNLSLRSIYCCFLSTFCTLKLINTNNAYNRYCIIIIGLVIRNSSNSRGFIGHLYWWNYYLDCQAVVIGAKSSSTRFGSNCGGHLQCCCFSYLLQLTDPDLTDSGRKNNFRNLVNGKYSCMS